MGVVLATVAALIAFAANSLLCRAALGGLEADAASFTAVRLASGALMLLAVSRSRGRGGSWTSAAALFAYAAAFSFAYFFLPAGIGALLLFGAVQVTMIGVGIAGGERPPPAVWGGLVLALAGLAHLSLRGRKTRGAPILATADNFLRALPFAALLWAIGAVARTPHLSARGAGLAVASGAITSGLGYVAWYSALPRLTASRAAVLQLCVPVLAAIGGVVLLGEVLTVRLIVAGAAILAGIALATGASRPAPARPSNA